VTKRDEAFLLSTKARLDTMGKSKGKIIIPSDANVWPHELKTAQALASLGHTVEFIRKSNRDRERSADAYIDSVKWELKAPTGSALKVVERNLKKARWQSENVVFDSRRMKKVPDAAIARELSKWLHEFKELKRIKFVNRHGIVTDIE
jgi:hypothetical protein